MRGGGGILINRCPGSPLCVNAATLKRMYLHDHTGELCLCTPSTDLTLNQSLNLGAGRVWKPSTVLQPSPISSLYLVTTSFLCEWNIVPVCFLYSSFPSNMYWSFLFIVWNVSATFPVHLKTMMQSYGLNIFFLLSLSNVGHHWMRGKAGGKGVGTCAGSCSIGREVLLWTAGPAPHPSFSIIICLISANSGSKSHLQRHILSSCLKCGKNSLSSEFCWNKTDIWKKPHLLGSWGKVLKWARSGCSGSWPPVYAVGQKGRELAGCPGAPGQRPGFQGTVLSAAPAASNRLSQCCCSVCPRGTRPVGGRASLRKCILANSPWPFFCWIWRATTGGSGT